MERYGWENELEFLILDEPATGLDPKERICLRNLLVGFLEGFPEDADIYIMGKEKQ